MKKRYLISAFILFISIFVDQLAKRWGITLPTLYYNQGFIMGLYSGLPDTIRIVTLGCFSGVLFFVYIFLMYIIPSRGKLLKYSLSLLVGGMFGNVIDKLIYGKTVDFIPFNAFGIHAVFNLADVFLWSGALLVLYVVLRKEKLIWYHSSTRGRYIISPQEQFKVGLNYTLVVFCSALVLGIFSFSFFNTTVTPMVEGKDRLMLTYMITFFMITLLFCTLAFFAGVILSHKSAGPLYAFELFVNDLIEGKDRKLSLREGDNYKNLEVVAERLREFINRPK